MATKTKTRPESLPLGLQSYHLLYMGFFSSIVIFGTLYSLLYSTHTYNVLLSNSATSLSAATPIAASTSSSASSIPGLGSLIDSSKAPATIFADRKNLLNRIFIKYTWFWTTVAFLAQLFTLRATSSATDMNAKGKKRSNEASSTSNANSSSSLSPSSSPAAVAEKLPEATVYSATSISVLRYMVATILWMVFASWFLGPPIMDRIRHYSGAVCLPSTLPIGGITLPGSVDAQFCYAKKPLTASTHPDLFNTGHRIVAAEHGGKLKAYWKGGHDISGHTYILILSSMYLLEEITPYLPYLLPSPLQVYAQDWIPRHLWSTYSPFAPSTQITEQQASRNIMIIASIFLLLIGWSFSLLFTALFFHTPSEKFSGLMAGLAAFLLIPKRG